MRIFQSVSGAPYRHWQAMPVVARGSVAGESCRTFRVVELRYESGRGFLQGSDPTPTHARRRRRAAHLSGLVSFIYFAIFFGRRWRTNPTTWLGFWARTCTSTAPTRWMAAAVRKRPSGGIEVAAGGAMAPERMAMQERPRSVARRAASPGRAATSAAARRAASQGRAAVEEMTETAAGAVEDATGAAAVVAGALALALALARARALAHL